MSLHMPYDTNIGHLRLQASHAAVTITLFRNTKNFDDSVSSTISDALEQHTLN